MGTGELYEQYIVKQIQHNLVIMMTILTGAETILQIVAEIMTMIIIAKMNMKIHIIAVVIMMIHMMILSLAKVQGRFLLC